MGAEYDFFERLIYCGMGARRFTQNSPIMPDVWIHFGLQPNQRLPLLLVPFGATTPGELAVTLRQRLREHGNSREAAAGPGASIDRRSRVAYNQTVVAADLFFDELNQVALPLSSWWQETLVHGEGREPVALFQENPEELKRQLMEAFATPNYTPGSSTDLTTQIVWLARVVGTIQLAAADPEIVDRETLEATGEQRAALDERIVKALFEIMGGAMFPPENERPKLFGVHRNRASIASLFASAPAVKADATRRVFDVGGRGITWAVIDSGIDARHVAFRKRKGPEGQPKSKPFEQDPTGLSKNNTRVKQTYDFVAIRDLLTMDPESDALPPKLLERVTDREHADLARVLKTGRVVDWDLLRPWLQIHHDDRYEPPVHPHGTHVAGIIGGDWRPTDPGERSGDLEAPLIGVAPEVQFIDVRALDDQGRTDEFSLMAAMQFVRFLNSIHDERQVHGANLSFFLRHDFSVFACGCTPVCQEAERLVGTGTVIVAAAGNEGMARYELLDGKVSEGYRSISITDPGNAEAVITVGATHRRDPHTYGVSYFSSRGPTGDGRPKPDLVAPGEKITSCLPEDRFGEMDGTSQAAPHVSGAVALLMERNPEMIGQPDFVKKILCDTATDLRREKYFQGAGMLDILRALQSV